MPAGGARVAQFTTVAHKDHGLPRDPEPLTGLAGGKGTDPATAASVPFVLPHGCCPFRPRPANPYEEVMTKGAESQRGSQNGVGKQELLDGVEQRGEGRDVDLL